MAKKSTATRIILKFTGTILQLFLNIIMYTVIVLLVVRGSQEAYTISYQVFGSNPMEAEPGHEFTLEILDGESDYNIASKLYVSKLIPSKYSFFIKTKLTRSEIMPGTYELNTSMDYDVILDTITDDSNSIEEGKSVDEASP